MDTTARLFIRLTPGTLRAQWNPKYLNEFHGGPETLLHWLAAQLGLPVTGFHQADRITEYAALDALGKFRIPPARAMHVDELLQGTKLKTDKHWKQHLARITEAGDIDTQPSATSPTVCWPAPTPQPNSPPKT